MDDDAASAHGITIALPEPVRINTINLTATTNASTNTTLISTSAYTTSTFITTKASKIPATTKNNTTITTNTSAYTTTFTANSTTNEIKTLKKFRCSKIGCQADFVYKHSMILERLMEKFSILELINYFQGLLSKKKISPNKKC